MHGARALQQHTNRIARGPLDLGLLAGVHQAIRGVCSLPDAHPVIHAQHLVSMLHCSFRHQIVLEFLRAVGPGSDGCSQLPELLNCDGNMKQSAPNASNPSTSCNVDTHLCKPRKRFLILCRLLRQISPINAHPGNCTVVVQGIGCQEDQHPGDAVQDVQLKMELLLTKLLKQQVSHLKTAHLETWHMSRTDLREITRVELTCGNLSSHGDIFRHTDT